jgi:asparagine synthase (glutamine-hydrolysing)
MSGLAGCVGREKARATAALGRMLVAPAIQGAPMRRSAITPVVAFGKRDSDLAEDVDRGELLALCGYVRLRGRPSTAAEVLAAWRTKGDAILDALSGEFTIAVLIGGRLVVTRDALGARPMYVAELPRGGMAFSTSLFALLYAGARADIDHDAVVRGLVLGYPTSPGTALESVRQLGPGELWELSPRRVTRRWFVPREELDTKRSLAAAVRKVDRAVTAAVVDAIPSSGRVAAFLSGGIDSSIVLARVHESGTPVEAFTLAFGDNLPGELRYARAVAQHLGVRHHVLDLDTRRFCDGIEPAVDRLEDVLSEAIAIPNFLLAREAAKGAEVLFTGEGGDQSFGGPKNVAMALAYAYSSHPAAAPLAHTYLSLHHFLWNDLARAVEPRVLAAFDPEKLADDVGRRFFDERIPRKGSFVGRVMIGNTVIKGGNNILIKAAKTIGFPNDLSLRSPMYDRRLVELAFAIPPWHKLDGSDEKLVLRRASLRSLPAWVVDRPKRGMMLPLGYWFARDLGALARDVLTERSVRDRGFFRWSYVEALLGHTAVSRHHARFRSLEQLWIILMTELHHRSIDRVARDARALVGRPGVGEEVARA